MGVVREVAPAVVVDDHRVPAERVRRLHGVAAVDRHDRRAVRRDHVDALVGASARPRPSERVDERHRPRDRARGDGARARHRERPTAAALGGQADLRLSLLVLELLVQLVHGRLQVGESRIQCRPLGLQRRGGLRLRVGLLGQSHALATQPLRLHGHRRRHVLVALRDVLREPQPVGEVRERFRAQQRADRLAPAGDVDGPHLLVELPLDLHQLRLERADLLLGVVDRVLRLGVRGLRLLPLQGDGVELGLLGRELLAGGVQVVLRVGLRGDGDQHPGEGGDGDDDAQGHAGDDLPQVVCLLVRGPCGPADGCAEATSAPLSSSTVGAWVCSCLVEEHAPALVRERSSGSARTSRPTSPRSTT